MSTSTTTDSDWCHLCQNTFTPVCAIENLQEALATSKSETTEASHHLSVLIALIGFFALVSLVIVIALMLRNLRCCRWRPSWNRQDRPWTSASMRYHKRSDGDNLDSSHISSRLDEYSRKARAGDVQLDSIGSRAMPAS